MTKLVHVCALLMFVFCAFCQGKTDLTKDETKSETKDTSTSRVPTRMVRNVKQARNGDILIASFNAVYRYDGKSFTNLTSNIPSPSFWDVLEDRKGNLWFGTLNSGVYYYNGKSFQHFTTEEGLASNFVGFIHEDKTGMIWFATGGGLTRYDGNSFRNFTTKDGLPTNDITTIMEDKTGKLWIGTRGDACFYDGEKFTVFRNKDGKTFYNVWSIIEDRKGIIWFGGSIIKNRKRIAPKGPILTVETGLWRYDGSTYTKVSQRGASAIMEDKKGNIWTTGEVKLNGDWALSRYDQKSLYTEKPAVTEIMSIKKGMLCRMLEANDGSIWFGSLNGVYRYDGKTITDFKSKERHQ
ncbi:ligand-binding sensor domain-containing protein [Larkinella terrae]|uniref:Histidine kinase n=1 Tax=Larkinella terrae TaxID=2025311 RepID=A0A7K0EMU4_9BACT|nr:two-component regulator propeller domain-containing protein [Larkinella terrae]MRS63115.1 histidine kinase [Larkinella terrae]